MGDQDFHIPEKRGVEDVVIDEAHGRYRPEKQDVDEVVLDEAHGRYRGKRTSSWTYLSKTFATC